MGNTGLKADPEKVKAIINLPIPTNKTEMSSFLGMCNYLASFVPDTTEPLRHLRNQQSSPGMSSMIEPSGKLNCVWRMQ